MAYQFDWNDWKAQSNVHKHGVSFELASTIFRDPRVLTIADTEHGEDEERWLSLGISARGALLAVVHLWTQVEPEMTLIRIISARRATPKETGYYLDNL